MEAGGVHPLPRHVFRAAGLTKATLAAETGALSRPSCSKIGSASDIKCRGTLGNSRSVRGDLLILSCDGNLAAVRHI